jgi:hypothetical protein
MKHLKKTNMNAKLKAKELVDKMLHCYQGNIDEYTAKQCALIAVDEILQMVDETMQGWLDADIIAHWEQVKKEISKL